MYTATWCGQCRRAKEYMALKHIPYHEIDVDTAAGKAGFMNTGERGVPVLVRDGENFVGFSVEYYEAIFGAPRDAIKTPGAS
jgi:glutaredoxin